MGKRRINRRTIKSSPAFIEPVLEDFDLRNGGPDAPPTAERRRIGQAREATAAEIQAGRFNEHDKQRVAENTELHARGLDPLQGDIEGPHREDRKQAAILDAEHKRMTGGRF